MYWDMRALCILKGEKNKEWNSWSDLVSRINIVIWNAFREVVNLEINFENRESHGLEKSKTCQ